MPRSTVTVNINEEFFSELGNLPAVVALITLKAEQIMAIAKATAPFDAADKGAHYQDQFTVVVKQSKFRKTAVVVNKSGHGLLVEAKHGTMARAITAARSQ